MSELKEEIDTFADGLEVHVVQIGETEHHNHFTLRFSKTAPLEVPIIIGDAIHNLRAALDLMMGDAARLLGKNPNEVKFPFANSQADFEELLTKQPYKRLGLDFINLLLMCAPYKGGNAALRGLHDLDVTDKHKAVLPIYVAAWGRIPIPEFINDRLLNAVGLDMNRSGMPLWEGTTIVLRKGIDPLTTMHLIEAPPEPVFPRGSPFALEAVFSTLEILTQMVTEIVEVFAAKAQGNDHPLLPPTLEDG